MSCIINSITCDPVFAFDSKGYVNSGANSERIETSELDKRDSFNQNLQYWNNEIGFMSVNNFDNSYFREIVNMGVDAVPFIIEELHKGPTMLVHALDLIFPGAVEYPNGATLQDVCDIWLEVLA